MAKTNVPYTTPADVLDYGNPNRHRCHSVTAFTGELRVLGDSIYRPLQGAVIREQREQALALAERYHHEVCARYHEQLPTGSVQMDVQTLSPRKASIALRKAGLRVVSCRNGGIRGMDVLCSPYTNVEAVMEVLREQGWANVRTLKSLGGDLVFASYPAGN